MYLINIESRFKNLEMKNRELEKSTIGALNPNTSLKKLFCHNELNPRHTGKSKKERFIESN